MKCYFCDEVELKGDAEVCDRCAENGLKDGTFKECKDDTN